jgi:hypothetical protein
VLSFASSKYGKRPGHTSLLPNVVKALLSEENSELSVKKERLLPNVVTGSLSEENSDLPVKTEKM